MKFNKNNFKMTANWKRIVSRILVLVMIMTTAPIAEVAYAAEAPIVDVVDSTDENLTETPDADSTDSTDETPIETGDSEDNTDEDSSNTEEETQTENPDADAEETPNGESTETPDADSEENTEEPVDESEESTSDNSVEEEFTENISDNDVVVEEEINTTGTGVDVILGCESSATVDLYLRGTMNGWGTDNKAEKSNGLFFAKTNLTPGTEYQFKFGSADWATSCHGSNHTITINEAETYYPIINGKQVTFRYESSSAAVYLAGTMNGWSSEATPMVGSDGVFTYTATYPLGVYQYKFVDGSSWNTDPLNPNRMGEGNSIFIVTGLADYNAEAVKGEVIPLPSTLDFVPADSITGAIESAAVTYELKTTEAADYVTMDGNNVTVSAEYTGDVVEFIAKTEDGTTSNVKITLVEKMYKYTVYAYSFIEDKMSTDESALHIWDEAGETEAEPADYPFTGTELINGKTWLKAEVKLPYSEKLGIIFREKEANEDGSQWATSNLYYANTEGADESTLYIVDGQSKLFTNIEDVEYTQERYLIVEYTNAAGNYANANVYTWNTGYGTANYKFKLTNGKYIAKIPVLPAAADRTFGFIVKTSAGWDKDGGDNIVTFPADQNYMKVRFADGAITETLPYNMGSSINRADEKINFYYRDDALFVNSNMASLDGKVQLVVKTNTGNAEIDNTYAMTYDETNERFYYEIPLVAETDYYYYFNVDGVKTFDAFNSRKITVEEVEYNLLRNVTYQVDLTANVRNAEMDYNDNNLLYINWAAKEGASIEGFTPEKIYADLSQLGLGNKVEINKELNALTISCKDDIAPGEKTITVTLIDDCDNSYKAKANVTVVERVKTENTNAKLGDFDWDEAVIYFAITDRFFDGNEANNTATEGYDASDETDEGRYHGGDFAGLTKKIDYLYDLGVNTIWITPIVDNVDGNFIADDYADANAEYYGYHGYWAEDFTKLNPHLGDADEFKALIDAAHAKGMKIMVDVVLNHAGYGSEETFNSILLDEENNPINMVRGEEETVPGDTIRDGLSGLPDFITEDEAVRNQLVEWQTTWMEEYDIDYYRVDTVKHVENTTWEAFKNSLTESNPEFKLIGEYYDGAFGNTFGQLDSGKMDSLLDFGFKYYAENFVGGSISSVEAQLAARNNGIDNTATLGSFLSSHDEDGLLYKLNNKYSDAALAEGLMKVAASLQITAKGQPVIYYGEEIGQTGANDWPYYTNRYDFDWNAVTKQKAVKGSIYNHYKKMLNIRRDYSEVFAKGTRSFVTGSDAEGYEVIRRGYDGTNIYVGMNIKADAKTATFKVTAKPGSRYTDVYSNKTYTVSAEGKVTVTIPAAKNGGTAVLVLTRGEEVEIVDTNTVSIKLHYYREDGEYVTDKGDWNVWMWTDGKGGAAYDLVNEGTEESPDMVATYEVEGRSTNKVGFIVRKGDWKEQEGGDRFIDISDVVSGTVHVYVTSGVEEFTRALGADAILGIKIVSATYDRETNKVVVVTSQPISGSAETEFVIKRANGEVIEFTDVEVGDCKYTLSIVPDLTPMSEIVKSYTITYDNFVYNLTMPNIYSSDEFEGQFTYTGNDLGATWSVDSTTFKVWAPTAEYVQLALYASGDPEAEDILEIIDMELGEKGVWTATVNGDINGTYYTYLVSVDGKVNEACDPYATTTGVNGKRAMVIDLDSTDPEGWAEDVGPHKDMTYTDAVIYELHVRDASIDESSGVSDAHKGKYLGLTETGTTTANGVSTGLDHIIDMGVTHVHLLPVYDYGSVDETKLDTPQFNWGYDPVNFNVPEGSYSTDPYNGEVRVKEFKQMVKAMHDNNINVIMDVVYNHVYDADTYCFNQIVPKYFSRTKEDGSYNGDTGCGNTTASERTMVQKYIVDSVLYWNKEYHIDGFRFDLVGLIDAETMNAVVQAVHAVNPDIIFYGEGWSMSSGTTKGTIPMATQADAKSNLSKGILSDLAYFSDTFRDNLAGNNTNGQGFVLGYAEKEEIMKACFTASTDWCPGPTYTVNYASCHDNYTLMDKLNVAAADATEEERIKMNNLSAAFYMLSEGIPFIHAGEEFLRTKVAEDGEIIHNSYNSPDYVNKLRWSNLEDSKYSDVRDYYKGLIEFRKNHAALRLTDSADVAANVTSYTVGENLLLFKINGKDNIPSEVSDGIVVIFNGSRENQEVDLSDYGIEGVWNVCINAEDAGTGIRDNVVTNVESTVTVDAISALVLVKGATVDPDSVYGDNFKEIITLNKDLIQLQVDKKAVLIPYVNVEDTTIEWTSDNEDVATVTETEYDQVEVNAIAPGTATITATTASGAKATCTVKVYEHSFVIDKEELTLDITKGETAKLEVSSMEVDSPEITWTTSDQTIATVSNTGLVTPIGVGETTVTAVVKDGPELTCQVTVVSSLESIAINQKSLDMVAGDHEILKAIINPVGAKPIVTWFSSDSKVATVNRATGEVTAVAAGKATITAVAEGKRATCEVTVAGKVDENVLEIPTGITAITNIHTKLSDVALPEGWAWVNGAATVKSFVGVNEKKFLATYTEEGCAPVTKEIPVNIITVSKVDVAAPAVLEAAKSADVNATIVTTGGEVPEEMVTVEWKSMKTDFMTVEQDADDELAADITGVKAGTTQVMATVTISDGVKSKAFASPRKSVKIVTEAPASISFNSIGEDVIEEDTEVYVYDFTEEAKVKVAIGSSASKVTLKSSDTGAVKVGTVKGENGIFTSELTIKKAGYVRLTATANDAMKSTTTFDLYIKNAVPNVDTNKIELNNKSTKTASVYVYANEDYEIETVSVNDVKFDVAQVDDTAEYKVSLVGSVDKGSYKSNLVVKLVDVDEAIAIPLTINVVSKEPTVTVKQVGKLNTFYKDERAYGKLNITSPELIANVELSECDFEYSYITGKITIKDGADRANLDKKGTLKVTFTEYPTVECSKNFTVNTEDKAPALTLSAKTATLYPVAGVETAEVTVNGDSISANDISVSFKTEEEAEAYEVGELGNKVTFTRTNASFTKKATVTITVNKEENYSRPVSLSYAISVNAKDPSLVLSKKALTLNKNTAVASYETDALTVKVKDAPNADIVKLSVGAGDAKAQKELGRSIILKASADNVTANLNDVKDLKKGSYKFNVYATIGTKTVKTAMTVKVVDATPQKSVKLTAKGSIDVLNRDTTAIVYTPKFTNMSGTITDVALTGRSAHLFKAEVYDGIVILTVKGDNKAEQDAVKLVTKYNYGVQMVLTLDNGENTCKFVTGEMKVKLTQSKPKVTVVPKQAVMFNTVNNNTVEVAITAANKDGSAVDIEKIELTNLTNAFSYADGKLVLTDRGAVAKGKTYTLKFNVYFDGCADSEKPTTVSYKVKVN